MADAPAGRSPDGPRPSGRWPEIYEKSLDCVHCGLCLTSCPTYRETGREISSPRGRIYLMRGVAEGRVPLAGAVAEEAYLCLGCRSCETACPSGVRFGSMLELARAEVDGAGLRERWPRRLERWALRGLVAHRRRLHLTIGLLALAQRLGLDRAALALWPGQSGAELRRAHGLLPAIPPSRARRRLPKRAPAEGESRGRVAFFAGCIASEIFGDVNRATLRVLTRNGFEVVVPRSQGCCGALHAHAGDETYAHRLARRNAAAFADLEVDAVVVNSAGCGAALREVDQWIPGEGDALAGKVRDVSEVLAEAGLTAPMRSLPLRVCYDDPCHLVHGQGVRDAPRQLLAKIPGVELVPHADPEGCCGAAGIYNLTHREMSQAVLARKLDALEAVDPDVVATGNPGCLMQLRAGIQARGLRTRVAHPIELLDEATA